jgi:hypothetical protein
MVVVQIVLDACPDGWAPPDEFAGLSGFPAKREAINAGRAIHLLLNREAVSFLEPHPAVLLQR